MKWYTKDDNDGTNIFVFGSNLAGRHGAGAAKDAKRFWHARHGVGNGIQGQAYAIPTKNAHLGKLPLAAIKKFVDEFIEFARRHSDNRFLVTEIGCGLAGYTVQSMAPLFRNCPDNCVLPDEFIRVLRLSP